MRCPRVGFGATLSSAMPRIIVEFFPGVVHDWDYFGIEAELAQAFGRTVDLATKKWLKPHIRARVLPEARVYEA